MSDAMTDHWRGEATRQKQRAEAAEAERDRLKAEVERLNSEVACAWVDCDDLAKALYDQESINGSPVEYVEHLKARAKKEAETGVSWPILQAKEDEIKRLRAVVEAARVQCAAADAFWGESFTSGARRALNDADEALRAALDALDAPEPAP